MKKWIGMICSFIAGACGFIFLCLDCWTQKATAYVAGVSTTTTKSVNGWDLIKNDSEINGLVLYKIFAIALLAVSVLLIISALVLLLRNLKVLKTTLNIDAINKILLLLFAICAIVMMIALGVMSKDVSVDNVQEIAGVKVGAKLSAYAGIGSWLNLGVGILAFAFGCLAKGKSK